MRKLILIVIGFLYTHAAFCQPKDFEGIIDYKTQVSSKKPNISEQVVRGFLFMPEQISVMIKEGNYRYIKGLSESWYIRKDSRVYLKFKGSDTLYYLNYSDDTSSVLSIIKSGFTKNISGFECQSISIFTSNKSQQYYYSPELYSNPDYHRENRLGRLDAYAKETSAVWLSYTENTDTYILTQTASGVTPKKLDDSVFNLPHLPVKKYADENIIREPVFSRTGGWSKYVSFNINPETGPKYLKIPRGQAEVRQTIWIRFMIDTEGRVTNTEVLNRAEVHPKLADEALRVVNSSPDWKPATIFGEKTIYWYRLPIVFAVTK
jgi:hypothetical protein